MEFDLCVLWQAVSLINLKIKRMLAFEKRYLRRNSTSAISTCLHVMVCSFSHVFSISLPSQMDKRFVRGHFVSG